MKVSIKHISELSGYSIATVSNALNDRPGVSRETAEQIMKIAKECGYIKSERIKRIKVVCYRDSGDVFNDSPFFAIMLESVENEARRKGYEVALVNLYRRSDDYDERVQELVNDYTTAILLVATEMEEESIRPFQKCAAPIVMLDCWFENINFNGVLMHNKDSVYQAVKYLIKLGHKRIGYVQGGLRIQNFKARSVGYQRAMNEAGLSINPDYIFEVPPSISGAYERMNRILEGKPKLPTALFADNDMIALGVMQSLQQNGYKIPEDISIIGFDDITFCEVFSPKLTTIRVNQHEMGVLAVRRLVDIIQHPSDTKIRTQLCNDLIIRESTAPPASRM